MAPKNQDSIPRGWRLEHEADKKGNTQEYYTNDLHQKFYSMEDLMRYVNYAMKAQLSIYEPPAPKNGSSTAKPCSKGKRKRSITEKSSSKKLKQKKTKSSTAKNDGTKKNFTIKFRHIFYRLSQRLNKPTKIKKYANSLARRKNIKDAFGKALSRRASGRLAGNAAKYCGLNIAAATHRVPNSPARLSLALTLLPPRASRRLSRQAPEYVPDFDPLLKF